MGRDRFSAFLDIATASLGAAPDDVAALARTLLAEPEDPGTGRSIARGRPPAPPGEPSGSPPPATSLRSSTLNNDGTPLELCISVGAGRQTCRLIGDPAASVDDADDRLARGRAALAQLIGARGPHLGELCERTLTRTLPTGADLAGLRSGALWLAGDLAGPGLALYTTASWGADSDRWERALAWLDDVLPDARIARSLLAPVRPIARLVACAIEGDAPARSRAKLYFRPRSVVPLAAMGIDLLCDPRVAELLVPLIGDAEIRAGTLVYSLGFALADGALTDAKLDVCAHCVPRPAQGWLALLGGWTHRLGHRAFGVDAALLAGTAEVAFVGLGIRFDGDLRTNLYLKPPGGR